MPRGGARPGGGRPKGSLDRYAREKRRKMELIADQLSHELAGNYFEGDAHAYLMSIYKNNTIPMPYRIDAAKACIPYEKPRLASVEVKREQEEPPLIAGIEYEIIESDVTAQDVELELEAKFRHGQLEQIEYVATESAPAEPHPARAQPERQGDSASEDTNTEGVSSTFAGIL